MSSLKESLAWTKEHYPDLKINEVNEFTDLCTSMSEERIRALDGLISLLYQESLENLLKQENKDWLSIQRHVETIVKVNYNTTIKEKYV